MYVKRPKITFSKLNTPKKYDIFFQGNHFSLVDINQPSCVNREPSTFDIVLYTYSTHILN